MEVGRLTSWILVPYRDVIQADLINEATRLLNLAEAKARKEAKAAKADTQTRRFPPSLEYEVLHADSILLLGLAQALR